MFSTLSCKLEGTDYAARIQDDKSGFYANVRARLQRHFEARGFALDGLK